MTSRKDYEDFLASRGLRPRDPSPRVLAEARERQVRMVTDFLAQDLHPTRRFMLEHMLQELASFERTADPISADLDALLSGVKRRIATLGLDTKNLTEGVLLGEFPVGSLNAYAVSTPGGYLVLVSSGALTMISMIVRFISMADWTRPQTDSSRLALERVAGVLAAYFRFGDPFLGPTPHPAEMVRPDRLSLSAGLVIEGAKSFLVAHELGHVVAGHFVASADDQRIGRPPSPGIPWERHRQHAHELEADEFAFRTLLGIHTTGSLQEGIAALEKNPAGERLLHAVACAYAAPFVLLAIDDLLVEIAAVLRGEPPRAAHPSMLEAKASLLSHPTGYLRMARLAAVVPADFRTQPEPFVFADAIDKNYFYLRDRACQFVTESRDRATRALGHLPFGLLQWGDENNPEMALCNLVIQKLKTGGHARRDRPVVLAPSSLTEILGEPVCKALAEMGGRQASVLDRLPLDAADPMVIGFSDLLLLRCGSERIAADRGPSGEILAWVERAEEVL